VCRRNNVHDPHTPSSSSSNQLGEIFEGKNEDEGEKESELKVPDRWFGYLHFLSSNYCDPNNVEASMRGLRERLAPGEISYRVLVLTHDNNEELLLIYRHKYEAKAVRGQSLSTSSFGGAWGSFRVLLWFVL
jgi:hypothetical protein